MPTKLSKKFRLPCKYYFEIFVSNYEELYNNAFHEIFLVK